MSNEQMDFFSYFGGSESFSNPSEETKYNKSVTLITSSDPAELTQSDDNRSSSKENSKVFSFGKNVRDIRQNSKSKSTDDCREDRCDESEGQDLKELDDDELEALAEDHDVSDSAADRAELAGKQVKLDANSTTKPAAKPEEKKPVFNNATFICYAGMNIAITKLFGDDSLATLQMEDIRKRLEKDYPELSKQRTKMEYDDKKNIICPMVTGGKKGASLIQGIRGFFFRSKDLAENMQPINILAARDGYYEVRENPIGVFVTKVQEVESLESCREGFKMNLPHIPQRLFAQLISFFADYAMYDVEVMGVFYWDTKENRYILDVPFQDVTKVSVEACYTDFPIHFIKVCEIHSHNTMNAYFSGVDNADELGTMLYGVIGNLQKGVKQITYSLLTRAGMVGRFIPLNPNLIIEGDFKADAIEATDPVTYPASWHNRVQIIGGITND